jgi:hypothetical protein
MLERVMYTTNRSPTGPRSIHAPTPWTALRAPMSEAAYARERGAFLVER